MTLAEFLYVVCSIVVTVQGTSLTAVRYKDNIDMAGKKCPSAELVFTETSSTALRCIALCQTTTGCASVFYNHMTDACYGCYGYYDAGTTIVTFDTESSTAYYYPDLCPAPWTRHASSCYRKRGPDLNWQEALDTCRSEENATLAEINDVDENTFLQTIIRTRDTVWIGLSDHDETGVYRWASTNVLLSYDSWGYDSPDDINTQNCAWYKKRAWHDQSCTFEYLFVCEKSLLCPEGWIRRGSSCYFFSAEKKNWDDALEYCQTLNANLIEVNDAEENTFLQYRNTANNSLWLGLNDRESEYTYRWVGSNALIRYSNWNDGEPSNSDSEDCVMQYDSGKWADYPCLTKSHHYVCEKPIEILKAEISG